MFAVNVRCLDGLDLHALEIRPVDGRSRQEPGPAADATAVATGD